MIQVTSTDTPTDTVVLVGKEKAWGFAKEKRMKSLGAGMNGAVDLVRCSGRLHARKHFDPDEDLSVFSRLYTTMNIKKYKAMV